MTENAREWIPPLGWPEKLLGGAVALWVASWFSNSVAFGLVAWAIATFLAILVAFRILRFLIAKLIWRLRYRLLVAFLFIAVIPIGLVVALGVYGAREIGGQFAVHLVQIEFEHQLGQLGDLADELCRTPAAQVDDLGDSLARIASRDFPGLSVSISVPNGPKHVIGKAPEYGELVEKTGLFAIGGKLFGGAFLHSSDNGRDIAVLAPLSQGFFSRLAPEVGAVSLLPGDRPFDLDRDADLESSVAVPPRSAWWDFDLRWATPVAVTHVDAPVASGSALLAVHSRMATLMSTLFSQAGEVGSLLTLLYLLAILILVAEAVSLFLGVSITRTITAAVHELYEGTERVMRGDFSHRIHVTGKEQIADLTRSFNQMTENVEKLLAVSKEKERMQAELAIARNVQQQLFPSKMPYLETLEMRAVCQPARQVSGDYYDYQALGDKKIVLALGDVAGKGISAALLMASLQSTLRVQLREWQSDVSTERLVTGLNQHLYLNTAPEKYATFFLALYDETSGVLEYTNAGHLPPLLVRAGKVAALDVNGTVVGAFAGSKYDSSHLQLEPGDLLACYTDGVTELENEFGEMFGEERLGEVLLRASAGSLDQVVAAILEEAARFSGSPEAQDDLTLLMVRRR